MCRERFDRAVSHDTVKQVLATESLQTPRRLPRYRDMADRVQRRKAIVALYLKDRAASSAATCAIPATAPTARGEDAGAAAGAKP